MELTKKQQDKLLRLANVADKGEIGLIEEIDALETRIEALDVKIESLTAPEKGEPGKDYILTNQDKCEIADSITVPVVEKIVEKTTIVKEQPLITEKKVTIENPVTPIEVRDKLETLRDEERLDASAIKNLPEATQQIGLKAGWGAHPITVQDDGTVIDKNTRTINFTGGTLTRSPSGVITVPLDSLAIGDPIISGTPNDVLFIDSSGNLGQNSGFTFDENTQTLGINNISNATDADIVIAPLLGTTNSTILKSNAGGTVQINTGGAFNAKLDADSIATSDKTFTFPNTTGTLALTSDIDATTWDNSTTLYNVLNYGLVGDAKVYHDGVATAASTTFKSQTASFVAGDVGKTILITQAGTGYALLQTTIATVVDSTTVTLNDAAVVSTLNVTTGTGLTITVTANASKVATALVVASGGSGYVAGDVGQVGYLTTGTDITFSIASVSGGAVTGVTLVNGGGNAVAGVSGTIFGCEFVYGTDNATALQALIDTLPKDKYNNRTFDAQTKTEIYFPPSTGFLFASGVTLTNVSNVMVCGGGSIYFGDVRMFTLDGAKRVTFNNLYLDGFEYNQVNVSPTYSAAFYIDGVVPIVVPSEPRTIEISNCFINRVLYGITGNTSGVGIETIVSGNSIRGLHMAGGIGMRLVTSDNKVVRNIINGFTQNVVQSFGQTVFSNNHYYLSEVDTPFTGDTTIGSPIITNISDTSIIQIGGYYQVTAGMPSASAYYKCISKSINSMTLDTNASSSEVGVTVSTYVFDATMTISGNQAYGISINGEEFDNGGNCILRIIPPTNGNPCDISVTNCYFQVVSHSTTKMISFEPVNADTGIENVTITGNTFRSGNGSPPVFSYSANVNHANDVDYKVFNNVYDSCVNNCNVPFKITSYDISTVPASTGTYLDVDAGTVTDTNTAASGTLASLALHQINGGTLAATNSSVTTTVAANLFVNGGVTVGTNETISRNFVALFGDNSQILFGVGSGTSSLVNTGIMFSNASLPATVGRYANLNPTFNFANISFPAAYNFGAVYAATATQTTTVTTVISQPSWNSTYSLTQLNAADFNPLLNSSANITTMVGFLGRPEQLAGGSGNITTADAIQAKPFRYFAGSSGTVTTATGLHVVDSIIAGGTGTITTQNGIKIDSLTKGTTNIGIDCAVASAANRWNLYIHGTADNSIVGNLRLGDTTAPTTLLDLVGKLTITNAGLVTKYNNIAVVSNGIPSELATIDLTAQSAAITAATAYAVPASGVGMYRVSFVSKVTTAATTSSVLGGTNGFQLLYTDPDGTVVTTPVSVYNSTGATLALNTTQAVYSGEIIVYAKASTNIQYQMDYTSVGATAMQYNLHVKIEAL